MIYRLGDLNYPDLEMPPNMVEVVELEIGGDEGDVLAAGADDVDGVTLHDVRFRTGLKGLRTEDVRYFVDCTIYESYESIGPDTFRATVIRR